MTSEGDRLQALERTIRGDNGTGLATRVVVLEGRVGEVSGRVDCVEKDVKVLEEETLRNTIFREQAEEGQRQFNRAKYAFIGAALLQIAIAIFTALK